MSDQASARKFIQAEALTTGGAGSESVMQTVGGTINYLIDQIDDKETRVGDLETIINGSGVKAVTPNGSPSSLARNTWVDVGAIPTGSPLILRADVVNLDFTSDFDVTPRRCTIKQHHTGFEHLRTVLPTFDQIVTGSPSPNFGVIPIEVSGTGIPLGFVHSGPIWRPNDAVFNTGGPSWEMGETNWGFSQIYFFYRINGANFQIAWDTTSTLGSGASTANLTFVAHTWKVFYI